MEEQSQAILSEEERRGESEIATLKKQIKEQGDDIVLLKSALSDTLRRLQLLEARKQTNASAKSKRPTSASSFIDHTPAKSSNQSKKGANRSPGSSFSSSPRPTPKQLISESTVRKGSSIKRKTSTSGLSKEEQAERDAVAVKFQLRGRTLNFYPPSDFNEAAHTGEAPEKKLQLDWVYGYRGKDCRNNLYCLPTSEIVYNTAAVVVIYNPASKTQRHYSEHTDDVKCLALHPNKEIIASGQVAGHAKKEGKPHIRIWNVASLQTLKVVGLGAFQRGLCCVAFSVEDGGAHVAGVDDGNDHNISIWEWENKKKVAEAKGGNEPVLAVDFYPNDSKHLVTCGKSHIAFWKLNGEKKIEKKMGVFEKHPKPKYVLCFAFGQNGEVISGDSNGNIFIWPNDGNQISQEITAAHEGPIFSIETSGDGTFLSGGGKDKKVFIWDSNYNKSEKQLEIPEDSGAVRSAAWGPTIDEEKSVIIGTTKNCILLANPEQDDKEFQYLTKGHSEETWGLCVHPSKPVFVTCGYDKMLYLWNSEDKSLVWVKQLEDELQAVGFHPNGNILAVATRNNKFLVLDADSGEAEFFNCEIGSEQHDCIKYSPDGSYLALGSHDNFIYLFTVSEEGKQYKKHGRLSGHSSYITHFDWSKDSLYLQSNSGDYEILYWQAKDCKQVSSGFTMRDTEWDTWSCVLGFPVRGMWPEGADGTDINTCIRSNGAEYLVNGDDSGLLNIFSYPCPKLKSAANVARGHSSHVTGVCFLATDSHVVSVGGKDNTVMQWKVES